MGWLIRDGALPYGETPDSSLRKSCETLTPYHTERGDKITIVASSFVGKVWYAAAHIQITPSDKYPDGLDITTAYVFLTCGNAKRGFGYKDMTEAMGPCECDCPAYILDMLTPIEQIPDPSYSAEWRAKCRARAIEKRSARVSKPKVGDTISFAEPIRYSGVSLQHFVVMPTPHRRRGLVGTPVGGHGLYRLPTSKLAQATVTPHGTIAQ